MWVRRRHVMWISHFFQSPPTLHAVRGPVLLVWNWWADREHVSRSSTCRCGRWRGSWQSCELLCSLNHASTLSTEAIVATVHNFCNKCWGHQGFFVQANNKNNLTNVFFQNREMFSFGFKIGSYRYVFIFSLKYRSYHNPSYVVRI